MTRDAVREAEPPGYGVSGSWEGVQKGVSPVLAVKLNRLLMRQVESVRTVLYRV